MAARSIAPPLWSRRGRYAEGVDEQGKPIEVVDRLRDKLMAAASCQREDRTAFLDDRDLFGDLVDDRRFVAAYTPSLESLYVGGARATQETLPG